MSSHQGVPCSSARSRALRDASPTRTTARTAAAPLLACAAAVLQSRLEHGDVERCAQVLLTASGCETPALAPLAAAAEECLRRKPAEVAERCRELGLPDVDVALQALVRMRSGEEPGL